MGERFTKKRCRVKKQFFCARFDQKTRGIEKFMGYCYIVKSIMALTMSFSVFLRALTALALETLA